MKLKSEAYFEVLSSIRRLGINWLTMGNLKKRTEHEYHAVQKRIPEEIPIIRTMGCSETNPPPPGASENEDTPCTQVAQRPISTHGPYLW